MSEKDFKLLKQELGFLDDEEIKKEFKKYKGDIIDTIYYVSKKYNKKLSEKFEQLSNAEGRMHDEDGKLIEEEKNEEEKNVIDIFIDNAQKLQYSINTEEHKQIVEKLMKKIPELEGVLKEYKDNETMEDVD